MHGTTDDHAVLHGVLDQWKATVDAHAPERVASRFTENAIFQGLHPYSVGRKGIADYYDSQPLGHLDVDFSFTDRPTLGVKLSVLVQRVEDGWLIGHYQVSRLD
ncbi:hypothetical protein OG252_02520 [Streptomyces sp. NBC_01352]|uniref:hypothetical protein n=1 Tax=Streptomyces sp. NBC_01352 TaxID=2903834 RepID=UPI002E366457|nr:hypothetical protein [Streptomyces sp. NBC_01352]